MENEYRVLFVGDERQHSSVESGDFFRLLERHSNIESCCLSQIRRQQVQEYRHGIELISRGQAKESFEHLDEHGYIHEDKAQYLEKAAESFVKLTDNGKNPLDCIAVSPTNRECELLTNMVREKLNISNKTANSVDSFRSWGWTKQQLGNIGNYKVGTKIFFNTKVKDLAMPGEMAEVTKITNNELVLSNGKTIKPAVIRNSIDIGDIVSLPLGEGDMVRFTVNLRTPDYKINNGSLAIATSRKNEYILLDSNRKVLSQIQLPEGFKGLKYGWVMTSHAAQGMTSKNVVVAAEKMSKQAFYVGCSRGKYNLALHIPEKDYFKQKLVNIQTERLSVHDLARTKEIDEIPSVKDAEQLKKECYPEPHNLVKEVKERNLRAILRKITKRTVSAFSKMLILIGSYDKRKEEIKQAEKLFPHQNVFDEIPVSKAPAKMPEVAPIAPVAPEPKITPKEMPELDFVIDFSAQLKAMAEAALDAQPTIRVKDLEVERQNNINTKTERDLEDVQRRRAERAERERKRRKPGRGGMGFD